MKPFFSIIIPTLNEGKYLPTILQSLAKQTFKNFELILVDGYSKDKTLEVFNSFKNRLPFSVSILSDKTNVGLQRNIGADKARGSYLIFFDADVEIGPTFLEEIHVQAIKKPFLLATTWMTADSKNPVDQLMVKLANFGWEIAKSVNQPFLGGFNVIIKTETFKILKGFREDLTIGEDRDLAKRALANNIELAILTEPKLVVSLRRFRSEGTLEVLRKYTKAEVYAFINGPITTQLFDYPMGGHVHNKKRKNSSFKSLKKIIKKFNKLLS
ncbi:glycosyltransferase family 2 protein [Candidatus Gottesmanbacteria bacterium]|nr:glycosyltransferase family 2 protein [Candidatus Gottesmanbacteria bacterium]